MFGRSKDELELEKLQLEAEIALGKLEANDTAKEVASKAIGKHGLLYLTILVGIGVVSSMFLPIAALAPVIGLISIAATALIAMMSGITGTLEKESNPLADALQESLAQNKELMSQLVGKDDSMEVEVNDGIVNISKGKNTTKVSK